MVTWLAVPQYRATVVLMVDPRLPDPLLGIPMQNGLPNHIPTEIEVVQSERVAIAAMRQLGMQNDPAWRARWLHKTGGDGAIEPWIARELRRNLDVRPTRETNVIAISYSAADGETAARVASAIAESYISSSAELRTEPARQYNAYFEEAAQRLRGELEQAQERLADHERRYGLVATDERLDVENSRLAELSSQVVVLQAMAADADERSRYASRNQQGFGDVQRNPAVSALAAELDRQENRLSEMQARLGDRHPNVVEARQSVADLRRRVDVASRRAAEGIGIESRMARDRLLHARRALETQRARILALRSERNGALILQREVDNARRAYEAVLTRSSQTAVEAGATRGNVSVLQGAAVPHLQSWPRYRLNLAVGVAAGLVLALLAAVWREAWDRRLRVADDIADVLGQSPLVVLPDSRATQRRLRLAAN
ncbi:GNVR domain-containing protein [Ramlibacter sp. AN1015]|uniref:GNVR domain-containing protein n=1 Tax=Ramlibacter sp. AN1015 TaxID=3133428 RepID=UPI0030C43EC5